MPLAFQRNKDNIGNIFSKLNVLDVIDMEDFYVVCRGIKGGLVSCGLVDVEEENSWEPS